MKSRYLYLLALSIFSSIFISLLVLAYYKFPTNHGFLTTGIGEFSLTIYIESVLHHLSTPFAKLLFQIIVILSVCKLLSLIFQKVNIPSVIGEITGGLVLGQSVLGYFYPEAFQFLFPSESMGSLKLLSQIGLIFFMFLIGLETDWENLTDKLNTSFLISHLSIMISFVLGISSSFVLFEVFAPKNTSFLPFALFLGVSMSTSAFPVMARIIQEKKLNYQRSGILALGSAATDDITAWFLLAIILGISSKGSIFSVAVSILFVLFFIFVSLKLIRQKFKTIFSRIQDIDYIPKLLLYSIFMWLIFSSLFTEIMGIHALFGAFIAGTVVQTNMKMRTMIIEKLQDVSLVFLLPLFFAYSGLNTELGIFLNPEHLIYAGMIIGLSIFGKFGGSFFIAKIQGETYRDSLIIGALMNTRGLMELIILNIGLDAGIISKEIFSIMVVMALLTTGMTSPIINLINKLFKYSEGQKLITENIVTKTKILIAFAKPKNSIKLSSMCFKLFPNADFRAYHVNQNYNFDVEQLESQIDTIKNRLMNYSKEEGISIEFTYSISENVELELSDQIFEYKPDLLVLGSTEGLEWKDIYTARLKNIVESQNVCVAVMINKCLINVENIFYPEHDSLLKEKLIKMGVNSEFLKPYKLYEDSIIQKSIIAHWIEDDNFKFENKNYLMMKYLP
jgi:Kef-type K+ transport system membrane component KefB